MSHRVIGRIIQERNEYELKKMKDKLPSPRECTACGEPAGFMNLIETTERISTYNEEKGMYEFIDTSRFSLFRCTNCNAETYL